MTRSTVVVSNLLNTLRSSVDNPTRSESGQSPPPTTRSDDQLAPQHQLSLADQDWDAAAMLDALPIVSTGIGSATLAITYCNVAWAAQYDVEPGEAIGRSLLEFLGSDEQLGLRTQLRHARTRTPGSWSTRLLAPPRTLPINGWSGSTGISTVRMDRRCCRSAAMSPSVAWPNSDWRKARRRFRELADSSSDIVLALRLRPGTPLRLRQPVGGGDPRLSGAVLPVRLRSCLRGPRRSTVAGDPRRADGELGLESFDFRVRRADGSVVVCETRTTRVRDGLQGVCRDVTELRRLQDTLAALALRDPLTGLANRRLLDELLDAELARTQQCRHSAGGCIHRPRRTQTGQRHVRT